MATITPGGNLVESNLNTSTSLAADLVPVFLKEKLLSIAENLLVFYDIGDKEDLPQGNGKTIQFTRYERLALPSGPLAESITPDAAALSTSIVQAVVDQWGSVVSISDVAELTVKHPVLKVAQSRLGTQHAELIDREIQKTLMGGSNVSFGGLTPAASRSAIITASTLGTDTVKRAVSNLRQTGAPSLDDGNFIGVIDPYTEMDLLKDSTFQNASSYSNIRTLLNGEVGMWMGVRWKRSNYIPILSLLTGITSASAAVPTGFNGFGASTVRFKVTKLDPQTGFETAISADTGQAITATQCLQITLTAATTGAGTFNIYSSLEGGAAGTTTFQGRVVVAGSNVVVSISKSQGTGTLSSTALVAAATGAIAPPDTAAVNVHTSYVFGREAFGVVDLSGMQTFLTPSTSTDSDPLNQRRKLGWKQMFKAVIKNNSFFRRIESASDFN